jgi:hypothetical protein
MPSDLVFRFVRSEGLVWVSQAVGHGLGSRLACRARLTWSFPVLVLLAVWLQRR